MRRLAAPLQSIRVARRFWLRVDRRPRRKRGVLLNMKYRQRSRVKPLMRVTLLLFRRMLALARGGLVAAVGGET